jgi:hypothetical protein
MTRTLMLCRLGLAGAATVAVLTACTTSGETNTASSNSAARTSSNAVFCDQARNFADEIGGAVNSLTHQNPNTSKLIRQILSELESIKPPADIATDWQTTLNDLQQMGEAVASVNLTDQQSLAQLEQRAAPLKQELSTSGQRIADYLRTKCGASVGKTASPTS